MAERNRTPKGTTVRNAVAATSAQGTREEHLTNTSKQSEADIRTKLAEHVGALRFVNGTIAVCVQALQQQAADMDIEIAHVLQRTAGDQLDATIDRIEAIALGTDPREVEI